jgi:stearoyl-CoA desaturase (delta-9 desaturase)
MPRDCHLVAGKLRSYHTANQGAFQFILACLAQSSAQKSVLWWAAKHRHHHLFSDTEHDVHSPRHTGFLFAHVGWIFARKRDTVDLVKVGDFTKYPELMWLHKYELVPSAVLAVTFFLIAGGRASSASSGARSRFITPPSASTRLPTCTAQSAM